MEWENCEECGGRGIQPPEGTTCYSVMGGGRTIDLSKSCSRGTAACVNEHETDAAVEEWRKLPKLGPMVVAARLEGAAIAAGIIALGEWARRCGRPAGLCCKVCGYDQTLPHPNADYSSHLWKTKGGVFCGQCADENDLDDDDDEIINPPPEETLARPYGSLAYTTRQQIAFDPDDY